jgi:hypothetical protein
VLDAILERGVRESAPAAPSALDAIVAEPTGKWSRGRLLTVRYEGTVRQDEDTQCVGGLFGAVKEATEPGRPLHGSQIPLGAVETDRGSGCCICGDKGCGIGPFVRV